MFTGIVEAIGKIENAILRNGVRELIVSSPFAKELKPDQSVCHNGICLTVTEVFETTYKVSVVEETLKKTNLGKLKKGDFVNLERSVRLQDRLDGHLVQGHVDSTGICREINEEGDNLWFTIEYPEKYHNLLIPQGSVTVNGVSLTIAGDNKKSFKVTIIPFTYNHTNFSYVKVGDILNLEFDLIGKYICKFLSK